MRKDEKEKIKYKKHNLKECNIHFLYYFYAFFYYWKNFDKRKYLEKREI